MMHKNLDLNDQNKITVMLMQALGGAVSQNFRMVAIGFTDPVLQLLFVLADESAEDREEIEDVAGEFDSLLLGIKSEVLKFDVTIIVNTEPLKILDPSLWRTVFRRREV